MADGHHSSHSQPDDTQQQAGSWQPTGGSAHGPHAAIEEASSHEHDASSGSDHGIDYDISRFLNDGDDTESDMSRDEERKHKNREAAARSRQRARERMARLEQLVSHLLQRNHELQFEVERLRALLPHVHEPSLPMHTLPPPPPPPPSGYPGSHPAFDHHYSF
ncbi:hypothetical protein PINS_up005776 [Pythium insidiosum]|nr:hypothetical protein PINS_up005776 [Pythium insidiosum]